LAELIVDRLVDIFAERANRAEESRVP
jgi:hypothetical protein